MELVRAPRRALAAGLLICVISGCRGNADEGPLRASGYVEATEVRVAPEVGGRILELPVDEGDRVTAGALIARLDTMDTDIALRRADADRAHAVAQLRLLQAGARPEDIRQAQAQAESAQADVVAAESELRAAAADLARFEALKGQTWNYPAIASGRLLVRNSNEMAAYDISAK